VAPAPAPAPRTRRSSDDAAQTWRRFVGRGSLLVALAGLAAAAAWLSPGAQQREEMEQKTSVEMGSGSRRHRLASAIARSAGMTQALAALGRTEALAATRAHMLKVVCGCCLLLCRMFSTNQGVLILACLSHTQVSVHRDVPALRDGARDHSEFLLVSRDSMHTWEPATAIAARSHAVTRLLICGPCFMLCACFQIKLEAEEAGVGMAAARHMAAAHASGSEDGGQLSRQELVKYIKHQENLLSNIESLSGININKMTTTHKPEHHFKHSKHSPDATEHYDNIFAKAKEEDDDPDAFADQSDNSGDASARAWNNVRTLSPPPCARPSPRSMPMPMPHRATCTRPSPLTRAPAHARVGLADRRHAFDARQTSGALQNTPEPKP
jgi:hypothetical protein